MADEPIQYDPNQKVYKITRQNKISELSMHDLLRDFKKYGNRVSDLHLKVGEPPCFRVDGDLMRAGEPLDAPTANYLIQSLVSNPDDRKKIQEHGEVDISYHFEEYQFRVNIFFDNDGIAAALRALSMTIPEIDSVGFPNQVWRDIIVRKQGLVLVTGITGAGKSTTIAALIQRIAQERACRIITLEDPIEYIFKPKKALISQREIGRDTASFGNGLRSMMREDPDVIFVGEMRDMDSSSWTLTAAETGHLVFSTLHTRDATGSITRILDFFPEHRRDEMSNQLSLSLAYVISQKLIPKKYPPGRVVAMEILNNNSAVANLIRTGKLEQIYSMMQTRTKDKQDENMMTAEKCLERMVSKDVIALEEAVKWANRPTSFSPSAASLPSWNDIKD